MRVGAIVAWLRVSTSKITGSERSKLRTAIGVVFVPASNLEKFLRFETFHPCNRLSLIRQDNIACNPPRQKLKAAVGAF